MIAMLSLAPPSADAADEIIDRVLAVAEGEVITLSDVRVARELGRVQVERATDPVAAALDLLIDRALILSEADRLAPPEPSAAAVDAALASQYAAAGSRAAFQARLAPLGVDEPFVRELMREDLRIRAYLDQRFSAESPEEQSRLVGVWVSGLRRRADVVNLYEPLNAAESGTESPARD
ncbi:MAG: hypothetical protein AB7Q29_08030 [Vicinamibacterales bacterium]